MLTVAVRSWPQPPAYGQGCPARARCQLWSLGLVVVGGPPVSMRPCQAGVTGAARSVVRRRLKLAFGPFGPRDSVFA